MSELTVGFVGLGNMGWPMAANLHAAGFALVVRDVDTPRQAAFAAGYPGTGRPTTGRPTTGRPTTGRPTTGRPTTGRPTTGRRETVAAAGPDAFAAADIVVTMLPSGAIVRDALLDWGIAAALPDGALVIEMSSSDPADTRLLGAGLARHNVALLDAPVSGGVPRALTGDLSLMIGGSDDDVARAQPVLQVLGDPARQFRTGGLGSGHAMKALNNVIAAATTCVTAEALVAGARFGLDPETMLDVINSSTGRSFVSEIFASEVITGRYGTGFALGLLAKDVRIAASVADGAGADAPAITLTVQRWAEALAALGPEADQSMAHQAWWADKLGGQ